MEENTKLIAEVPSLKNTIEARDCTSTEGPYILPPNVCKDHSANVNSVTSQLRLLTQTSKILIEDTHELQRKKAMELLDFVISDTDRIHNPNKLNQIPVAYALKGYSLTCEVLQDMIEEVMDKYKMHNIEIVGNCFDGQWSKLTRDKNSQPLTHLQFQKECWSKYCKQSKANLTQKLVDFCKVTKDSLAKASTMLYMGPNTVDIGNLRISQYMKGSKKVLAA